MSSDNSLILFTLADKVVSESKQLTKIWSDLDHYKKHGTLVSEPELNSFDLQDLEIGEIVNRLLTLPSYITKETKKLSKLEDGPKKEALAKTIELKKKELQAIKDLRHQR